MSVGRDKIKKRLRALRLTSRVKLPSMKDYTEKAVELINEKEEIIEKKPVEKKKKGVVKKKPIAKKKPIKKAGK